jgi:hypothetical protein
MQARSDQSLLNLLLERVGNSISEESAFAIIEQLYERRIVTANEAMLMRAAVERNALMLPISAKTLCGRRCCATCLLGFSETCRRRKSHDVRGLQQSGSNHTFNDRRKR